MTIKYCDNTYITDNDLKVVNLGFWPKADIKNEKLKRIFEEKFGRAFLGGDDIISYAQPLVSRGMNFEELEEEILKDIENPENKDFKDILFSKTATGIGRGHSLGGLSGIVLGIHGTKMIDSGLTGLCASRSLVTSSRRRETEAEDIAIPESFNNNNELLKEYMKISEDVLKLSSEFKEKFGKLGGIETFNKVIPYNKPADLFIVLPLDTLSTIIAETRHDKSNPNGNFIPKEIHKLAQILPEIARQSGQGIMLNQRIEVPRDTYLHYTVFKDPSFPNYAIEIGKKTGMAINPKIIECSKDFSREFLRGLEELKIIFEETRKTNNPEELHKKSLECMYALRNFSNEFNEALRIKIADTMSWRVSSEQKRHATLRQNVESVYSAASRASNKTSVIWPIIEKAYSENNYEKISNVLDFLEEDIVIDERIKKKPEIIIPYIYHTANQLRFYRKMIENGFEQRDSLYIVPKDIRLRTLEHYDLINLIDLELPLRLCDTCEPERQEISWKKRDAIAELVAELDYFLVSKCGVGFCTEGKFCKQITSMRNYSQDLHKETKQAMLNKARGNL